MNELINKGSDSVLKKLNKLYHKNKSIIIFIKKKK